MSGIALMVAMGAWGFLTAHRVPAWASDRAIWTAAADVAPTLPRPRVNLCAALGNTGELEAAFRECATAVSLTFHPQRNRYRQVTERATAQAGQALVVAFGGHLEEADRMLQQVEREWPALPSLPAYRAALNARMGR